MRYVDPEAIEEAVARLRVAKRNVEMGAYPGETIELIEQALHRLADSDA